MGARRSGGGGCALQTLVARDLQAGQAGPEHLSFFGLFLSSSTSDSVPLLTYRNSSDLYLAVLSLLSGAIKSTTKHLCSCLFSWLLIKLPPAASAHPAQPEALTPTSTPGWVLAAQCRKSRCSSGPNIGAWPLTEAKLETGSVYSRRLADQH